MAGAGGLSIQHPDELHLKGHRLPGQRVVEVEAHRPVGGHFHRRTGVLAAPVGGGELHHVAHGVLLLRVAQAVQQLARHPLHHLRLARAEGLTGGQLNHRPCALLQPQQALLQRRREFAAADAQRARLAGLEGVDDDLPLRTGQAVVQGEK